MMALLKSTRLANMMFRSPTYFSCLNLKIAPKSLIITHGTSEVDHFFQSRLFSSREIPVYKFPSLMDFKVYLYPNVVKSIRNHLWASLIIQPFFDNGFKLSKFKDSTKQIVETVSYQISHGNFEALEGLVSPIVISEITENFKKFSLREAMELEIRQEDILFCFPYEMLIYPDHEGKYPPDPPTRFVEIRVAYHVLRGSKSVINYGPHFMLTNFEDYKHNFYALNYRFIRAYRRGLPVDNWMINGKYPPDPPTRFVEIRVAYHVLRGSKSVINYGPHFMLTNFEDYKHNFYALNYRFIRAYRRGLPVDNWMINGLNHLKTFSS